MNTKDMIVSASQGNPGCAVVLSNLYVSKGVEVNPLLLALLMTESRAPCVWLVFKDLCKQDYDKTWEELKAWFDSSVESLGSYMAEKHPDHKKSFEYYS